MKVNFDATEYALLVDLADAAATTPAVLVHDWTMRTAAARWQALQGHGAGAGSRDGDGETGTTTTTAVLTSAPRATKVR